MSVTPITDMIAEMHASGIQLDMIIVAVRSMERAMSTRHPVDVAAEKRRAWDREYRRNKRSSHPPDPPDIHPNPPDVGNSALSSFKEVKKLSEEVSKKESKSRGTKIPPDWKPNHHHYDEGAKRGMSPADVDERASSMREWCEANANRSITTKANWDAAFMGAWLKQGNRNGNRTGNTRTSGHDAILAVAARKARELDRNDAMAGGADSAGFAGGDGIDGRGPERNSSATGSGQRDHHGQEPDDKRIREGEIIPPDKNAAGVPRGREFV